MSMRWHRASWAGVVLVALVALFLVSGVVAQSPRTEEPLSRLLGSVAPQGANEPSPVPLPVQTPRYSVKDDGYLRFLGAPPGHHFPVLAGSPDAPVETARAFLEENRELFRTASADVAFAVIRQKTVRGGHHVRLRQTYAGIPVVAAEIIALIDSEGGIQSISSDILSDTRRLDNGTISLRAGVTPDAVLGTIRTQLGQEAPEGDFILTAPELMIWAPSVVNHEGPVRLVWHSRVSSDNASYLNADFYVDAQLGSIVHRFARYYEARDREIRDSNNTTALPGTLQRSEGDPASGIVEVDNAYAFLGDTYDFYAVEHGRDGLDDSGSTMLATTRWCKPATACPWGNASWDGTRMKFGDGYAVDDVTGHELTHGVTGDESGLVYENTSGAISESFSDIWGEYIDLGNGAGTDTPAVRWLMGEDLPGGTLRDMADPTNFSDPDRLGSGFYIPPVGTPVLANDFGGVHSNSGIPNKLCYLLTDGDSFNGRTIHGEGISFIADLFYEVQVNLLGSTPDWTDFTLAVIQAAVNLGWGEADLTNLFCALVAVELLDDVDPPELTLSDATPTFNPPNPWTQEGVVIETLTIVAEEASSLTNVRFFGEALQCPDVPCETDHLKKLSGDMIEFVPPHIAYIPGGETVEVEVKFTVPIGKAACVYAGKLWLIADVDGFCQDQVSADVDVELEVTPIVDMDIDDNHANVSHNVLHLKGAKNKLVSGVFTIVNPNSEVKNVDLTDGPGNIRIEPVEINVTNLVKIGDTAVSIPAGSLNFDPLNGLSNGEAQGVTLSLTVPDGIPINAFYRGTVQVVYADCIDGDEVSDKFTVELEVLPTQGTLDIIQTNLAETFCPDDPWTMVGQVAFSFDVHANGDHRNIRVSSGGLKHESLDKKLDEFNFFPEEIAFLAAGETRTINVITKIPIGQHSGNYADYFRVVSENAGEDSVHANIEICPIYDMDIKDNYANLVGGVMEIQAIGRSSKTGGEWKLRAFDLGLPAKLVENHDEYDGPGNTPVDCITCEFGEWSPLWHEDDHDHHFHTNFLFKGSGDVMGKECTWRSGEFKRMWVSIFVPPMKMAENHPGTYKVRLDCYAVAGEDTVASDYFDIELQLARIVGPDLNTIDDDAVFAAYPAFGSTSVYWGDFTSVGLTGSVNLYRRGPGDDDFVLVNQTPLNQSSSYEDTNVVPGEMYSYRLGIESEGEEMFIGPVSVGGTPLAFQLSQNAPNPFRSQTTIAYELAEPGRVSLRVFDISGRLVRVLADAEQPAGFYNVTWDGRDNSGRRSSNGIYFYRLDGPEFTATKKMVVIR